MYSYLANDQVFFIISLMMHESVLAFAQHFQGDVHASQFCLSIIFVLSSTPDSFCAQAIPERPRRKEAFSLAAYTEVATRDAFFRSIFAVQKPTNSPTLLLKCIPHLSSSISSQGPPRCKSS